MQVPPIFDWARSAVIYDDLGRKLVLGLKHGTRVALVPVMAQMMVNRLQDKEVDILMPVPLHRTRLLRRRFNQSQLLAGELSRRLSVPCDTFSLRKSRATASQSGFNKKGRFRNVHASFVVDPARKQQLDGKTVILVDDVLTTGATASACAVALKKAGAASVGVVTYARVGRPVAG